MRSICRIVSLVCITVLLLFGTAATAGTGTIDIQVHPGGGTVCLGTVCKETESGDGGPAIASFSGMDAGQYHMLNVYGTPGYRNYLGQVYLDPSGTSLVRDIVLQKLPPEDLATGTLQVFITPDGGRACLNRMCELSRGDGTGSWSVEFPDVPANTDQNLTVINEGYETYETVVRVPQSKTLSLSIVLTPLPPGSSPTPTSVPAATPQPTHAALPGFVSLAGLVLGCIAWVLVRHR
jgi:hypothetical protein